MGFKLEENFKSVWCNDNTFASGENFITSLFFLTADVFLGFL
jgi:hypothetical protein